MRWNHVAWLSLICCTLSFLPGSLAQDSKVDTASEAYFAANALYNRKLYSLAADQYRAFLKEHPKHEKASAAQLGLALSLLGDGKRAEALPTLEKALQDPKTPNRDSLRLLLANALLKEKKYAEADQAFAQAVKEMKDPAKGTTAQVGRVEALYHLKKWDELEKVAAPLLKDKNVSPQQDRVRFLSARAAVTHKKNDDAIRLLQGFRNRREVTAYTGPALTLLADLYRSSGKTDKALPLYRELATKVPGSHQATVSYAAALLSVEHAPVKESLKDTGDFLKRFKDDPRAGQVALLQGRAYEKAKDPRRAREAYKVAMKTKDLVPEASVRWLNTPMDKRTAREAGRILVNGLKAPTDNTWTPYLLKIQAETQEGRKRFDEAGKAWARLLKSHQDSPLAPLALQGSIRSLQQQKKFQDVLKRIDAAPKDLRKQVGEAWMLRARADALTQLGQSDKAMEAWKALIQSKPGDDVERDARVHLSRLAFGNEDWKTVRDTILPLVNDENKDLARDAHWMASTASFQLEAFKQAVPSLTIALADDNSPYRKQAST